MITPILDCSGFSDVTLTFDNTIAPQNYCGSAYVDIRIDGGSWQNLITYAYPDNISENTVIDISIYADDQSSVEIRWYNWSITNNGWSVDNVSITGTATYSDDIAAVSIDNPTVSMGVGIAYTPKVTVLNNGTEAQTFNLNLTIENTARAVVYNENITGISLDPSLSTQVVFSPDFTPALEDNYTFTATVDNPGDEDNANDAVVELLTAYPHFGEGVPDIFGNTWKDNTVEGGPTFDYIDIYEDGTAVGYGDDVAWGPISIGFSFPFYGTPYSVFYVNTNGLITMTTSTNTRLNYCPVPAEGPADFWIAPFWDDLNVRFDDGGNIYYKLFDADVDYLVIQWHNFIIRGQDGDPMDMEVILYANGDILFQYDYINSLADGQGQGATVGIEQDASDGLSYLCNDDRPGNRLYSGLAIGWYPPVINHDVGVASIDSPTAPLVVNGAVVDVTATITNYGINSETFDVDLEVKNSSDVVVFSNTKNMTIADGASDQVAFDSWTVGDADDYTITVTTLLAEDENAENDELASSLTAVDVVSLPVDEDFEGGTFPPEGWSIFDFAGSNSWSSSTSQYRSPTHSALGKFTMQQTTDDWLVMAPIDMSVGSNIRWLYYEQDSQYSPFSDNGLRHSFYVCTDMYFDPVSLTPFEIHTPADHDINDFVGDPVEFDLSAYAGYSHVWLAFRLENAGPTEYWWIDDISVFNVPNADVGVYSIDLPLSAIVENCTSPVEVTVKTMVW